MIERLLLDRVAAKAARTAIAEQLDTARFRSPYEAQTALPIAQLAGARADIALHTPVREHVPIARVDDRAFRRSYCHAFHRFVHVRHCAPFRTDLYSVSMHG